jgi:hypothetical protein
MWYKVLVNKEGGELNLNSNSLYYGRQSYNAIFTIFKRYFAIEKFTFIDGIDVYVGNNQLIINKDGLLNIIAIVEDNNLIIDKSFERDYPVLYRKFKPVIQEYSNNKFDITYTDYCGRTRFLEFEKPKVSSIKERDELVQSLLEEVYN